MKKLFFFFFIISSSLFAGSLRLHNDSPYKLRAVIRAADGTYLGEVIILPEHTQTWSSEYPSFGPGGQYYMESPSRSQTPYTVLWYCMSGKEYGVSSNLATGAAVFAESSSGSKICRPPKKDKGSPYGAKEDDEQLHQEQNTDETD